jgi:DNA-binding TFAR19-related protein (PDSD5 family)
MKIRSVSINNRKAQVELTTRSGKVYPVPFSRLAPPPTAKNRIVEAFVDRELASEAATYVLESGAEGAVHIEQALEYNEDPSYLADLLTHQLTTEALRRLDTAGLSRRELARRLNTSIPQLYRLLDPANTKKNISQLIALLHVLDCDVQLVVKQRGAA